LTTVQPPSAPLSAAPFASPGQATAGQATAGQATAGQATAGQATAGQATAGQATTAPHPVAAPLAAPDAGSPASGNGGFGLTQRLRSMLPWPTTNDPIGSIIRTHRGIHPGSDAALVRRAYAIAEQMHRGQYRKSGQPYITHPVAVTEILAELGMDTITLVAALLHDTVEDTSYTLQALESDFGEEVALLVDGVTKFDRVFYGDAAEAETIRKMIVMAGRDVRVLVIKLADRLHNMRTIEARSPASRARIASATRDVLVPLCDRLGIQALKRDLEDCVLQALSPSGYALIADYVRQRQGWTSYLDQVITDVNADLKQAKVDATVSPRPRHLYSIWKDTVNGNYTDPHDLPRVVIVVDGPETDCYAALGAVHGRWRPVPGRFKDFIASPKNNLYRSLHTTVLGPQERLVEVLIRTAPMHRAAEFGIVANFRYPTETSRFGPATHAEQLAWLRRVLDWEGAAADPAQFLASLRCDLAESQIIVFTSTGRPVLLPAEATPVDLAYTLGVDVGHRCVAARLNGRLVPLSSVLVDGDAVEIITRPGQRDEFDFDDKAPPPGPEADWLDFVKSSQARLHIGRWFEDNQAPAVTISSKVRLGRLAVGLALRQQGRGLTNDLPLIKLAGRMGYPDLETVLVAVAEHRLPATDLVAQLISAVDAVEDPLR
jgi:GTP pyrophosphokinase